MSAQDNDHVDELLLREHRRQEITEKVYSTFLQLADGVPEEEWRLLNIGCVTRLAGGLGASIRGDASAREFGLARCGHCEALLSPKSVASHVCDPADLERIKKALLGRVPQLVRQQVRVALDEENFRALVAGGEVKIGNPPYALLILSDIGFRVMKDAIRTAEEKSA